MNRKYFCCDQLFEHTYAGELGLVHIDKWMEFGIEYRDGGSAYQKIEFCPFCSKRLPRSLKDKWFDELEKQGIDPWGIVPKEFESTEWLETSGPPK